MANLSSVQTQIEILKTGDDHEKKRVIEPSNIEEVKNFIAENKGKRGWEAHEASFKEWEVLINAYAQDKLKLTTRTNNQITSQIPGSIEYKTTKELLIITDRGSISNVLIPQGETIRIIPNSQQRLNVQGGNMDVIKVQRPNNDIVFVQVVDISFQGSPNVSGVNNHSPSISQPSVNLRSDEIKEALKEINPANLENAINISESVIGLLQEPMRSTMRGVHGAIIFDTFRNAGHNLILKNGQIEIVPKPGTDVVNLQEKLQTLINTRKLSLDSLKLGILYSSPSFKEYAGLKKTTDTKGNPIIDPTASTHDFMKYLRDLEQAGNKSGDIQSILQSSAMLQGVNMPQAIKGFQDLGQVGDWIQKNQESVAKAAIAGSAQQNPSQQGASKQALSTPSNLLSGEIASGVTGGKVTGVVGDSIKGLFGGIGDIFKLANGDPLAQAGIAVGLIYGIYKLFQKTGFFGGVGVLLGAGAVNAFRDIEKRFGGFGGSNAPTNKLARTPTQEKGYLEMKKHESRINAAIDGAKKRNPKLTGTVDQYVDFIHSDAFQNQKLSDFLLNEDNKDQTNAMKNSIFTPASSIASLKTPVLPNLDNAVLKLVIRSYLGIPDPSGEQNTPEWGKKEKEDFIKKAGIDATWKDKTMKDLVTKLYQ